MIAEHAHPLATFVDRLTMVYERTYPHPIDLVWEAVTTAEHLDAWMLPEVRIERRLGGACAFGWGGPPLQRAEITVWEPPTAVQYTMVDDGASFMRFDLASVDAGSTAIAFTLHFRPPADTAPVEDDPGGDLPGGPGTAWRPGFLVGYHHMIDRLDDYLRHEWSLDDNLRDLERFTTDGWDAEDLALIEVYRRHVRDHCPPA